jgi:signal transduction histidine kinase
VAVEKVISCEKPEYISLKSRYRFALLFIFVLVNFSLPGQDNSFIKNFPPHVYKASPAVFNMTSDHQDLLYFGTNKGVVIYDGARWEIVSVSNFSDVKTLELGPDSLVYVGANGNFGYLQHDPLLGFNYVSISDSLPRNATNFNDIWQIVFLNNKVYFQSYAGIFNWDGKNLEFDEMEDVYIFAIDDQLYGSSYVTGEFGKIIDGAIQPIEPFPDIKFDLVFQVFDYDDSTKMLTTSEKGIYLYNPKSGKINSLDGRIISEMKKYSFYEGLKLDNNNYAMGTFNGGIFFMDKSGGVISVLNKENGLFANHIYDMKLDKRNNLWLATSYGISRVLLDSLNVTLAEPLPDARAPILRNVNFNTGNQTISLSLANRYTDVSHLNYELKKNNLDIHAIPSFMAFYFAYPDHAGDDISYSSFLEGYDKNWSDWKAEAVKEYTNLKGGKYRFQIKARNDLTGEISNIESFDLSIIPPWHQSNWIKIVVVLIIILIIYIIVRLTILRLKTKNIRLEKTVNERTQDLLEQQQKLSELNKNLSSTNKELDSFVYHTSHDLKAPLKSILGLVSLAKLDDPDKRFFEYHDRIEQSIHKLEEFISSIIQFSTNSKTQVKPIKIDFRLLIENAIRELQYHDDFDKIKITQKIRSNGSFISDEKRIQIILNNLLSNAIKYSDQNKSSKTLAIDVGQLNEGVRIVVEDNGIGISDEFKDRVFKMFYRASEKSYGSGLGLYIVQETVKKLGGSIRMESAEGLYTRFIIDLPNQSSVAYA